MTHVVVGILYNEKGQILIAEREKHKHQGGRWEFPGGKVEKDEKIFDALQRELQEEIGITVVSANQWHKVEHVYTDKTILLDIWHVISYLGEPYGKEGQLVRWVSLEEVSQLNIPDANWSIVKKLME